MCTGLIIHKILSCETLHWVEYKKGFKCWLWSGGTKSDKEGQGIQQVRIRWSGTPVKLTLCLLCVDAPIKVSLRLVVSFQGYLDDSLPHV